MKKSFVGAMLIGLLLMTALSLHAQWARIIEGSENEYPTAFLLTNDGGIIVLGYSSATTVNGSFFLKKISGEGEIVWSNAFW